MIIGGSSSLTCRGRHLIYKPARVVNLAVCLSAPGHAKCHCSAFLQQSCLLIAPGGSLAGIVRQQRTGMSEAQDMNLFCVLQATETPTKVLPWALVR